VPVERPIEVLLNEIRVPKSAGQITGRFIPRGEVRGLIVLVQNLPGNYGVQVHAARLIEALVRDVPIEIVCVDGASGPADFSVCDALPSVARRRFFKHLLRKGYATAPEYLAATKPHLVFELWGVDSPRWFRSNHVVAAEIIKKRDDAIELMRTFTERLLSTCAPSLSTDFRILAEARQSYLASDQDGPYDAEGRIKQTRDFDAWLARNRAARAALLKKLKLYGSVTGALDSAKDTVRSELDKVRVSSSHGLPPSTTDLSFDTDIDEFALLVLAELSQSPLDGSVLYLLRAAFLCHRAVQLALPPDQADRFTSLMADGVFDKIEEACRQINRDVSPNDAFQIPDRLKHLLTRADRYYQAAANRSSVMATNTVAELARRKLTRGVLWVSGFHTPHCVESFQVQHGFAVLVVTPKVGQLDHQRTYDERIVSDESDHLEIDHSNVKPEMAHRPPLWMQFVLLSSGMLRRGKELQRRRAIRRWRTPVVDATSLAADARVLAVGCAAPELLAQIGQSVISGYVVGMDHFHTDLIPGPSPEPISSYLRRAGVSNRVNLINHITRFAPFMDSAFDAVISTSIDAIFNAGERKTAVREWVRVLKPGGQVAIVTTSPRQLEFIETILRSLNLERMEVRRFGSFGLSQVQLILAWKRTRLSGAVDHS
jgi:ubiquinone/menaquinone biosynthesis C-methylase UbiE